MFKFNLKKFEIKMLLIKIINKMNSNKILYSSNKLINKLIQNYKLNSK